MPSITSTLPPELLGWVFAFLSASREDIAACRLVCHAFRELSSPFLITYVVLAKRIKTINKLREVAEHPYFSRYVSNLVWDASTYNKQLAMSWDEYVSGCRVDLNMSAELTKLVSKPREGDSRGHSAVAEPTLDVFAVPDRPVSANLEEDEQELMEEYCDMHTLGWDQEFARYRQLFLEERHITDTNLTRSVLAKAFAKMPKLRRVQYTDFRALAKDQETYETCCRRLFGNTLPPNQLREGHNEYFTNLLNDLAAAAPAARIESIEIGSQSFEDRNVRLSPDEMEGYRQPLYIPVADIEYDGNPTNNAALDRVLTRLRHLCLRIGTCHDDEGITTLVNVMRTLLTPTLSTLCHLQLDLKQGEMETVLREDSPGSNAFKQALPPLRFECLHTLDLRNWYLPGEDFKYFLLKHASTLRYIRLLGCVLADSNPAYMAEWAGRKLQLDGIELSPNQDGQLHLFGDTRVEPKQSGELHWPVTEGVDEAPYFFGYELYPHQEDTWLSGRPNLLKRESVLYAPGERFTWNEGSLSYRRVWCIGGHPDQDVEKTV